MKKYYPGEPVNIHIQIINKYYIGEKLLIATKKGKDKLPLFRGNGELLISIYGLRNFDYNLFEGK